jgi:hypothetical protein
VIWKDHHGRSDEPPWLVSQSSRKLYVKEIIVGDGEVRQRYVLVYNPKEAERQRQERQKQLEALQTELN